MKKITLSSLFILCAIVISMAQPVTRNIHRCSTAAPSAEWDEWFNQKVEEFKADQINAKSKSTTTYVIPVVIHVIHGGQNVGTFPNLSDAQVLSQFQILTDDFQGVGYNTNQYASMGSGGKLPFYNYAVTNNLPAPNNNGVAIGNLDIQFKPAWKKPNGDTLDVVGIDRVNYSSHGWTNPASFTNVTSFQNYMDGTIKPSTIWDPTKYLNVWISDCNTSSVGILGYSTFPASSTLTGLGAPYGNSNDDGTWVWSKAIGNVGTLDPSYNKGRTLTHELGHYFGLRHTDGDANCGNDFCNDVPPTQTLNYVPWPTAYPYNVGTCTGAGLYKSNSVNGEMFMNFMDYSDDAALWMFTNDQDTRIKTALANSPYRSNLTASSWLVCKPDATASPELIAKQYLNLVTKLYPNPATDNLSIVTNFGENTDLSIVISNTIGQVLISKTEKNIASSTFNFDISNFGKGIYFVTFTDSKGTTITKKLIKE